MGMCCQKMMMIGWRNAWSMKLRVQDQGEDQRRPGNWKEVVREDCQARKLNKEDAMDRCKWRKVIKEVRWRGWVWAGECFFWYRPTRVVPDKRPLNGCCCCCCSRRQDPYFSGNPNFLLTPWDRSKEASKPKHSSIRPVVSIKYRLVTNERTDRRTQDMYIQEYTALA